MCLTPRRPQLVEHYSYKPDGLLRVLTEPCSRPEGETGNNAHRHDHEFTVSEHNPLTLEPGCVLRADWPAPAPTGPPRDHVGLGELCESHKQVVLMNKDLIVGLKLFACRRHISKQKTFSLPFRGICSCRL